MFWEVLLFVFYTAYSSRGELNVCTSNADCTIFGTTCILISSERCACQQPTTSYSKCPHLSELKYDRTSVVPKYKFHSKPLKSRNISLVHDLLMVTSDYRNRSLGFVEQLLTKDAAFDVESAGIAINHRRKPLGIKDIRLSEIISSAPVEKSIIMLGHHNKSLEFRNHLLAKKQSTAEVQSSGIAPNYHSKHLRIKDTNKAPNESLAFAAVISALPNYISKNLVFKDFHMVMNDSSILPEIVVPENHSTHLGLRNIFSARKDSTLFIVKSGGETRNTNDTLRYRNISLVPNASTGFVERKGSSQKIPDTLLEFTVRPLAPTMAYMETQSIPRKYLNKSRITGFEEYPLERSRYASFTESINIRSEYKNTTIVNVTEVLPMPQQIAYVKTTVTSQGFQTGIKIKVGRKFPLAQNVPTLQITTTGTPSMLNTGTKMIELRSFSLVQNQITAHGETISIAPTFHTGVKIKESEDVALPKNQLTVHAEIRSNTPKFHSGFNLKGDRQFMHAQNESTIKIAPNMATNSKSNVHIGKPRALSAASNESTATLGKGNAEKREQIECEFDYDCRRNDEICLKTHVGCRCRTKTFSEKYQRCKPPKQEDTSSSGYMIGAYIALAMFILIVICCCVLVAVLAHRYSNRRESDSTTVVVVRCYPPPPPPGQVPPAQATLRPAQSASDDEV